MYMKILNYLRKLEKEEGEKLNRAERDELELFKQFQKSSILSRELKYRFLRSIKELESIGGDILKLSKKAISDLTNNKEDKAGGFLVEAFDKIRFFNNYL